MEPSLKGNKTVGMVAFRLLSQGYTVLYPMIDEIAYDLLIETRDGIFLKIQCKTGRYTKGAIRFNACSTGSSRSKLREKKDYIGRADVFGVWCPDIPDKVYFVPVDKVPSREVSLRIDLAQNNQNQSIRWATDYELLGM